MSQKRFKTDYPGVRYRQHPKRKHGVQWDKYFFIRYRIDGKDVEEAVGWASEKMTAKKAAVIRAELLENQRRGIPPFTLRDKRQIAGQERRAKQAKARQLKRDMLTFSELFDRYLPISKNTKKEHTWKTEVGLYKKWIEPVIGNKELKTIAPIHLERIKFNMTNAGRAPRSVEYTLAVVRQVFNFAIQNRLFNGANPTKHVKAPRFSNQRLRFLTREEADELLKELDQWPQVHNIALLSLHCGLRAGEVFSLTWADVDIEREIITLKDTKSKSRTRPAFMTQSVKDMFTGLDTGRPSDLVFPARGGGKIVQISDSFGKAVDNLGLNNGIKDRRQKIIFHSLRHTFGSWLAEAGVDLYRIQKLMGHQSFELVQRYAHLLPDHLKDAVKVIEAPFNSDKIVADITSQ